MSTPFTAEEQLVRRSLFGSLFNVAANKLNKPIQTTTTMHYRVVQTNECQQPCSSSSTSSSSLYSPIQTNNEYQQHFRVYVDPKTYFQNNLSPVSPSIIAQDSPSNILGQQMNRLELDFNLQNETIIQNNQIKHQEEIYQEIVSECRALEQQQNCENNREELSEGIINNTLKESSMLTTELITPTSFHPLSTTLTKINSNNLNFQLNNDPKQQSLFLPSNSPSQQQLINENLNNNNNFVGLSLEHLVKVLVQTVKEVTGNSTTKLINNNVQQKEKNEKEIIPIYDETAEQILERRRKQNNAAAARYRRRQRKVESIMQQELALLERRNYELRTSIANIKAEIDAENALLKALKNEKNNQMWIN